MIQLLVCLISGLVLGFAICLYIHWPLTSCAYILAQFPIIGSPIARAKEMCERGWKIIAETGQKTWTPEGLYACLRQNGIISEHEEIDALKIIYRYYPRTASKAPSICIFALTIALDLAKKNARKSL